MSVKIMSMVWERGPKNQSERFVLLALADYANDNGECWPSISGICQKTCLSERGVQTVLKRLVVTGWLQIETGGGRRNCNLYRIKTPHADAETPQEMRPLQAADSGKTPQMDAQTPHQMHPPYQETPQMDAETPQMDAGNPAPAAPEPSLTIKEPSLLSPLPPKQDDPFDAFWQIVPKRVGKAAAQKAWVKATKSADPDQIIAGMRRYAAEREGKDPQYTAHPSSWLNAGRWADEAGPSNQDFHNMISEALGGQDAISGPRADHHSQAQRLPAPLQEARPSGPERSSERAAGNGGGAERAYAGVIQPRRFGGSH